VEKAARLLRLLAESPAGVAPAALARELRFSRAATHRLLRALEKSGFVRHDADSDAFVLGYRLIEMVASHPGQHLELRRRAAGAMLALRHATGESVSLYALVSGAEFVCLETIPGIHEIRRHESPGHVVPLARGATSMALLAARLKREGAASLRAYLEGLEAPERPGDVDTYCARLGAVAESGFAYTVGERIEGAASISAAIEDGNGLATAALTVSGPDFRLARADVEGLSRLLVAAAARISEALRVP
jgi:DNA-binding IclR family transcriptional regulator